MSDLTVDEREALGLLMSVYPAGLHYQESQDEAIETYEQLVESGHAIRRRRRLRRARLCPLGAEGPGAPVADQQRGRPGEPELMPPLLRQPDGFEGFRSFPKVLDPDHLATAKGPEREVME